MEIDHMRVEDINVFHIKTLDKTANIRIIANVGSSDEVDQNHYGFSHFIEHLFFKGTKHHSYKELNCTLSKLGHANAYTDYDRTVYHLKFLPHEFDTASKVMAEMLCEPHILECDFNNERNVILEEIKSRSDDPFTYFFDTTIKLHFGDNAHEIAGDQNTISKCSLDDINSFRSRLYNRNKIAIGVVGNIPSKSVFNFASSIADLLPNNTCNERKKFVPRFGKDHIFRHDAKQAAIAAIFPGMDESTNIEMNYVLNMLVNGIGGGSHSIIFNRLRDELGLCYNTGAYQAYNMTMIYAMLDASNIERAQNETATIVNDVMKYGFDNEILETTRKLMLFDLAVSCESPASTAKCLFDSYFYDGEQIVSFDEQCKKIEKLTNTDVIECARLIFGGQQKWSQMLNTHAYWSRNY